MVTKSSFELSIFDSEPYFASLTPLFRVSVLKMTGLRFTKSSKVDFVTIFAKLFARAPVPDTRRSLGKMGVLS